LSARSCDSIRTACRRFELLLFRCCVTLCVIV
jgi:hypothetical protein